MSKYASALKKIEESRQSQTAPYTPKLRPVYKVPDRPGSDNRRNFLLLVLGFMALMAVYFFGLKRGLDLNKPSGPAGANAFPFTTVESGAAKPGGPPLGMTESQWATDPDGADVEQESSAPSGVLPSPAEEVEDLHLAVEKQDEAAAPPGTEPGDGQQAVPAPAGVSAGTDAPDGKKDIRVVTADVAENYYTIQLAAYRLRERAREEAERLAGKGHDAFLLWTGGLYQVCVGNFESAGTARQKLAQMLRDGGLKAYEGAYVRPVKQS